MLLLVLDEKEYFKDLNNMPSNKYQYLNYYTSFFLRFKLK